jgi:hypothetical protein
MFTVWQDWGVFSFRMRIVRTKLTIIPRTLWEPVVYSTMYREELISFPNSHGHQPQLRDRTSQVIQWYQLIGAFECMLVPVRLQYTSLLIGHCNVSVCILWRKRISVSVYTEVGTLTAGPVSGRWYGSSRNHISFRQIVPYPKAYYETSSWVV